MMLHNEGYLNVAFTNFLAKFKININKTWKSKKKGRYVLM